MVSTFVISTPIFEYGTDGLLFRDKLANRPEFKDGTIDIDNLCSELRAKARCSESGVVVDHKDVEAALQRLPESQRT